MKELGSKRTPFFLIVLESVRSRSDHDFFDRGSQVLQDGIIPRLLIGVINRWPRLRRNEESSATKFASSSG